MEIVFINLNLNDDPDMLFYQMPSSQKVQYFSFSKIFEVLKDLPCKESEHGRVALHPSTPSILVSRTIEYFNRRHYNISEQSVQSSLLECLQRNACKTGKTLGFQNVQIDN